MKVSRKVARRSRKHTSSISRRRFRNNKNKKSGYKKRYAKTQKGGKYGKRGRGQKRMGACTHKRGKRFHRGGVTYNQMEEYATINTPSELIDKLEAKTNNPNTINAIVSLFILHPGFTKPDARINERNHENPIITLTCQKKTNRFGISFPAMPQKFDCHIAYKLEEGRGVMLVMVLLKRKDNEKIGFSIFDTPENVTIRLRGTPDPDNKKIRNLTTLENIQAEHLGTTGTGENYSFNFPDKNNAMFDAIADVIDKFKADAIRELKPQQQQQQQQQQPPPPPQQQQQQPQPDESSASANALAGSKTLPLADSNVAAQRNDDDALALAGSVVEDVADPVADPVVVAAEGNVASSNPDTIFASRTEELKHVNDDPTMLSRVREAQEAE